MYHVRDYRHCEAQFCNGKKRIDELEAENAALKEHVADHQLLFKDYAAAQHRIKQLRGACEAALSDDQPYINKCKAALALPDSTAELDAVMKDAERYRFIKSVQPTPEGYDDAIDAAMKGEGK